MPVRRESTASTALRLQVWAAAGAPARQQPTAKRTNLFIASAN
jgi:hypothetical protein